MGKPTLLVPGKLAGAAGRSHPDAVPIEYITRLLQKEMPEFGGRPPKSYTNRVFVVKSETGSGKSTVLPAYIFRLLRSEKTAPRVKLTGPGVVCTQPRILTAQTIARDQAADNDNYPDLVMGVTVGYQTGPVNEKPLSGLIYATAGSLLAQLRLLPDSDIMARYRFIIVDEAHERSLDIDALLMRLKLFLKKNMGNPRLPFVILASATLPVKKYASYFDLSPSSKNIVEVEGRSFPVDEHWPQSGTNNYPVEAARLAVEIHESNLGDPPDQSDILIFMPGLREIETVTRYLTQKNWRFRHIESKVPPYLILNVHRTVVLEEGQDYRRIKEHPDRLRLPAQDGKTWLKPGRRIIVSTVVAETGLTIETLKYVIDCGWSRVQEVYYPGRFRGIVTRPAPRSRIEQRKGRAGRKFPGQFFPLYTKSVYSILPEEQLPDIIMEGISDVFLDIVEASSTTAGNVSSTFRVENIDMLDPPPVDALASALEESIMFGYLRPTVSPSGKILGHHITKIGEIASRFTHLRMHHVQTLLAGHLWRVSLRDLALMVALFDERDALLYEAAPSGPGQMKEARKNKERAVLAGLPSYMRKGDASDDYARARHLVADDFVEALIAYEGFVRALDNSQGDLPRMLDWCEANGVSFEGATKLTTMREEVINEMIAAGLNPFWGETYSLANAPPAKFGGLVGRLKQCIYSGLRFSLLTRAKSGEYQTPRGIQVDVPPFYNEDDLRSQKILGLPASQPQSIVTNTVWLRPAKRDKSEKYPPLLYRLRPGMVSVLDGYVCADSTLTKPRV
jgi:HrpA-like RNA helicase